MWGPEKWSVKKPRRVGMSHESRCSPRGLLGRGRGGQRGEEAPQTDVQNQILMPHTDTHGYTQIHTQIHTYSDHT